MQPDYLDLQSNSADPHEGNMRTADRSTGEAEKLVAKGISLLLVGAKLQHVFAERQYASARCFTKL